MIKKYPALFLLVCKLSGCTFNFDLTSQRTALENQIMGSYRELDDELILMSTVRGAGGPLREVGSKERGDILLRRRNQQFNRDDIDEFKDRGLIGETNKGLVAVLMTHQTRVFSSNEAHLAAQLVAEENKDRKAIWLYIIAKSRGLDTEDLPRVAKAYSEMQHKELSIGHWYQDNAGIWRNK